MADRHHPKLSDFFAAERLSAWLCEDFPGYVYVYDSLAQRYVFANRALSIALGLAIDSGEAVDVVTQMRVHPDDAAMLARHHERLSSIPDAGARAIEYRIQGPTGSTLWVYAWESSLACAESTDRRHLLGVALDVSERVAAQSALARSEQSLMASARRWRSIVENPFDYVVVVDRQYTYTFVNFVAPGLSEADLIGKATLFDFMESSDHARVKSAIDRTFATGQTSSYEVFVPLLDRWYQSVVGPIRESGEVTEVSILTREITAEKRLEAERGAREAELASKNDELELALTRQRALEAKLMQVAKLEAVGQLAGGIAHDFNNLLTGIGGVAALLARRLPAGDPLHSEIGDIRDAVERGAGLTRQLLAFSRQQMIAQTTLDLNVVLEESARMLSRLIGENIELVFERAPELWLVHANRSQLEQVLMNLAVNARDAMPNGGELVLTPCNLILDAEFCQRQPEAVPGRYVRLSVTDTGSGMDAATLNRIFEPFFTTKPVGSGTGLGLSTVYGIVKQAGGFIQVWSELGRGTRFEIHLPVATEALTPVTPRPRFGPGGVETVFLVEDDPLVLRTARRVLESLGYGVQTAAAGDDAISRIEAGLEFDLLLTDVILPGCDGHTVYRHARLKRPDVRVLFMSGYTDDFIAEKSISDAGGHFLHKPFTPDELASEVRDALDGRNSRSKG